MYVVPFVMGPIGSPLAKVGIQVTDSVYVAVSMGIMTRMGHVAWQQLGKNSDDFTRCLHSLGDCNPERRYICHFPLDNTIWSFGSRLRRQRAAGQEMPGPAHRQLPRLPQGWMAEHMLLMGVTSPQGEKTYVAAAFPSACGKTNFAMLIPPEKYRKAGWKVTTVGDDIAWMWVNRKRRPAVRHQSRGRLFRRRARHQLSRPTPTPWQMHVPRHHLHQRRPAARRRRLVGRQDRRAARRMHRLDRPALDARIAAEPPPIPTADSPRRWPTTRHWIHAANDPDGVPVSGIIFGGRRSKTMPLVYQAFNWIHGVYIGATLGSETTAAATGQVGVVRRDPMAMLPFFGYNIRDYFVHWFRMRKKMKDCPRIFHVNWFRKDDQGKFLWPGFGENMRVLEMDHRPLPGPSLRRRDDAGLDAPRRRTSTWKGSTSTRAQFEAVQEDGHRSAQTRDADAQRAVHEAGGRYAEGTDLSAGVAGCAAVRKVDRREFG